MANACIDYTRGAGARAQQADPAVLEDLPAAGSQEDAVARTEVARRVQSAISRLAPKIRMAIVLRYFEELSYAEMADILKCSMGTVASRLSRGHAILAQALAPFRPSSMEDDQ